ncbi:MAG TPA: hypothetical protein ENK85_03525 [Saprospiraceae bacterium]|nr:hypothetical protein [Saprospiraceae bacterium]
MKLCIYKQIDTSRVLFYTYSGFYKYYFVKDRRSDFGFYAGIYSEMNIILETEEAFFDKYREINPTSANYLANEEKGLKNISVGFGVGYKFLIKSHLVIEPAYFLSREFSFPSQGALTINGDIRLGVGYRF